MFERPVVPSLNSPHHAGLGIVLVLLAASCNVYDPALASEGVRGARPREDDQTAAVDAGPEADGGDEEDAGSSAANGGRQGGSPVDRTVCGDARVTGPEKCDTAIAKGDMGACPTVCPELRACAPRELNGSGCQAACVLLELVCAGGDSCCPEKCHAGNDPDCSSSCGDGILQASSGETCEPDTSVPCKRSEAECDDGDPCTTDTLTGSAENCNTACVNTPKQPGPNDGCCEPGSDANLDEDCEPRCGNGVREGSEECDGGNGCDGGCRVTMTGDQRACIERFGGDECDRCACLSCTESYMTCRAGPDAEANAKCTDVLVCARANKCLGDTCYCSDELCLTAGDGPCAAQIQAAAATTNPLQIRQLREDAANPLGRSYAAEQCRVEQCADACR
jgi:hypothetical protein